MLHFYRVTDPANGNQLTIGSGAATRAEAFESIRRFVRRFNARRAGICVPLLREPVSVWDLQREGPRPATP